MGRPTAKTLREAEEELLEPALDDLIDRLSPIIPGCHAVILDNDEGERFGFLKTGLPGCSGFLLDKHPKRGDWGLVCADTYVVVSWGANPVSAVASVTPRIILLFVSTVRSGDAERIGTMIFH